ncbi:MAG TPA: hypothetical protein GXX35_00385 [Thermoanaerobacterales bacterium]|nr:hypothetical protein [Thermoanaerobacterales bacterium]
MLFAGIDMKILEHFPSRRHSVYKVKLRLRNNIMPAVLKIFKGEKAASLCQAECENLLKLSDRGIRVPRVLERDEKALLMEYLEGVPVSSLAQSLDMGSWIEETACWLVQLHGEKIGSKSLLKGDANLRNFIFFGGKTFGIDFEEMDCGDFRQDLAEVCFFLLTDDPSLTPEKDQMVRRFLKTYEKHAGISIEDMDKFILESRSRARIRRKCFRK